jgi:eukaryotic-like serine/threonine-protein kinase
MAPSAGQKLGPYEIVKEIGVGGMGEVYRARDSRLNRDVAIKVLPEHLIRDAQALARFAREAKALAALSHPNLLVLYDVGSQEGVAYAVTELLEGETLRERLSRGPFPWRKVADLGAAIAEGLEAAHSKGIVHYDIKPGNIFLTRDGRVKILDFGLAQQRKTPAPDEATATMTETDMVMGTIGYMSPEQVRGQKAEAPSDIFSLGCVLYEMAAGRRAFSGESVTETMAAILKEDPPALADSGKQISLELERAIERCLAKNPAQRFHSAHDLAFSLRALATSQAGTGASSSTAQEQAIDSLVVIPFENASGTPETEYLSEGITEAIINHLSQLSKLRVVPRNSAFRCKGREADYVGLRQELGVRGVVTGRMMQFGNRLTISAELVDASTERQLWGERYNRELSDIFAVQEEIAAQISGKLRLRLTGEEKQRLVRRYTDNQEAYQLYLKGRFQWARRTPSSLKLAVECFQQAIQEDPLYALAYAGLSDVYILLGWFGMFNPGECLERSMGAAAKAVEIDPELAEGQAALGFTRGCDRDWSGAEAAFQRALQIDPAYWLSLDHRAFCLSAVGRSDEAIGAIRRAQQIDPLSPIVDHHAAWVFFLARQYDEAVEQCRRALDLDPAFPLAWFWLGLARTETGVHEEAVSASERACELLRSVPFAAAGLGHAYARAGRAADARKVLGQLTAADQQFYVDPFHLSLIHAGLGERDHALECLEHAYRQRSIALTLWGRPDPRLDPLRSEARFADVLRRIGV